jgi:hypothetical protein
MAQWLGMNLGIVSENSWKPGDKICHTPLQ